MKITNLLIAGMLAASGSVFADDYTDKSEIQQIQGQDSNTQEQVQDLGDQHRQSWNRLDADQDGYVSREEAAGDIELSDAFQNHDENEDGQLSAEEFSDWDGAHDEAQ